MTKKMTCKEFVDSFQLDKSWRKNGEREVQISAEEIISSPLCGYEQGAILTDDGETIILTDPENITKPYDVTTE
jgi:hypothetical protein